MAKVYVATSGDYSDYGIDGVFSAKELAEEFVQSTNPKEGQVEEYELDEGAALLGKIKEGFCVYYVQMDRDGNTTRIDRHEKPSPCHLEQTKGAARVYKPGSWGGKTSLIGYVMARDDVHALKIMNERRAQIIAEGGWE